MNKAYRLIWSAVRECWLVVSEKVLSKGCLPAITVGAITVATLFGFANIAHALPSGGQLAAGQATISQPAGGQMNINQTSNRAVINWNSFGIASGETVNISQPSSQSALLNRVLGNSPSEIFGKLNANGQVFLVNPNGVLFGKGASVNVGGLVASSLNIKDNDFMSGNLNFSKDGQAGSVINQGEISAGFVALLGPNVDNSGSIIATRGSAALGAADSITLNFDNNGLIALKLDQGALNAQASNSGIIAADGGRVLLTAKSADNILKSMVNNSGVIQARTVENRNGEIVLLGDTQNGTVNVDGTLDVSGKNAGQKGGSITVLGDQIGITGTARLDASGANGGGTVLVGGDWQGSGTLPQAGQVFLGSDAGIDASAINSGDGGKVVFWSDVHKEGGSTRAYGSISATGAAGGKGGLIETSGHNLDVEGSNVNAGNGGTWLLDPWNVTISNGGTNTNGSGVSITGGAWTPSAAGSNISNTTINAALNNGQNVTITTTGGGAEAGNITVNGAISKTAGANSILTLTADNNIVLNAGITAAAGQLTTTLNATAGNISGAGAIHTNGGLLTLNAATAGTLSGAITGSGGLTKTGSGITILTANNSYSGATTINAGTLQIGNGGTTGTLGSGAVIDNGTLALKRSGNISLSDLGGNGAGISGSGSLTSVTGSLILDRPINLSSGIVNIRAGGSVTQTEAIKAGSLLLLGNTTGSFDLSNTGNDVGILAANGVRNLNYKDANVLTIGQVDCYFGLYVNGTVSVATQTNNLSVAKMVYTTNTSASAILLNAGEAGAAGTATGGDLLFSGTGGVTTGAGGRATLMTGSISGTTGLATLGGVTAGHFRYNSDEIATNYSAPLDTGRYAIYREQPTVTVTTVDQSKTYDGTVFAGPNSYTATGLASGDAPVGAAVYGGNWNSSKNVGTYNITMSGLSTDLGYAPTYKDGALTISKASLTLSANDIVKTYDGTTNANGTAAVSNGTLFSGDSLIGGSFAFSDKNAGHNKTVTVSGITVSGGNSGGNYNVSYANNSTSTINKAALTIGGITADSKTYDGTTAATVHTGSAIYTGLIAGDDVTVNATGTFSDKNVGVDKTVALNSSITGVDANNYNIISQAVTHVDINKANLTITANNAGKTYDSLVYSGGNGLVYNGFVNGENASVLGGALVYGGSSQGAVKVGNYSIMAGGLTSGNYNLNYLNGTLVVQAAAAPQLPYQTAQWQNQINSLLESLHGLSGPSKEDAMITGSIISTDYDSDNPDKQLLVMDSGVQRGK